MFQRVRLKEFSQNQSLILLNLQRSASKSRSRAARHSTNVLCVHNQPTADMIAPLFLLKTQSTVSPYKLNAFLANAPVVLPLTPYTDYLLYLILHNSTENRNTFAPKLIAGNCRPFKATVVLSLSGLEY